VWRNHIQPLKTEALKEKQINIDRKQEQSRKMEKGWGYGILQP